MIVVVAVSVILGDAEVRSYAPSATEVNAKDQSRTGYDSVAILLRGQVANVVVRVRPIPPESRLQRRGEVEEECRGDGPRRPQVPFAVTHGLTQRRTASFTTLKLSYQHVPEPSALLLLGAGVAGLLFVGSRRRS